VRTTYRIASATIALAAVFPLGLPAAHAEAVSAQPADVAAWFWDKQVSGNVPGTGTGPIPGVPYPGQVPAPLSGVDADRFAVSYQGGTEKTADGQDAAKPEKETYLSWDIYSFVEPGAIIDSFVITLPLDANGESNRVTKPDAQPELVACKPAAGFGAASGDAFAAKPADDCADVVFGSFDAAKSAYVFDISTYAQDWVDGDNFGIAIRPKLDETVPFQLQFAEQAKLVADWSYTNPAAEEPVFEPEPFVPEAPPVDGGFSGGVDTGGFVPQPQPQPQPVAPKPVVPIQEPRPVQRAAAVPFVESSTPTWQFWAAAMAGVVLLGVVSLILGDDRVPVADAAGSSRLDSVLRSRQRALGTATPARPGRRFRTV
jgi:hypothetical protein